MKLATLCSGIGAPEVATKRLGWECLWSAEIESFPSAVLAYHHPESINLGDITVPDFDERAIKHGRPDILVFGTPCQSFSVAGKRAGMDDPRGVLAFVSLGIVARIRPVWFVFENVPGLLSSNAGRDFGAFLRAVDECGYSGAWASPDAQWFGVPQRRQRVFFVGHSEDWRYPAAALSEFSRLSGHPTPSREKGEEVAGVFTSCSRSGGWGTDVDLAAGGYMRAVAPPVTSNPYGDHESREGLLVPSHDPACTITAREYKGPLPEADISTVIAHILRAERNASKDGTGRGTPIVAFTKDSGDDAGEVSPPIRAMNHDKSHANAGGQVAMAFTQNQVGDVLSGDVCAAMGTNQNATGRNMPKIQTAMSVRRLLPVECEKLQGFEPGYTAIPYKGKPAADGPRYRALGNSMCVNVMEYLLKRIEEVEGINEKLER
jgi:DNA (cytosine-5)-methyltransferase 1